MGGRNSNHQSIIPIPRSDRMVMWGLFRTQSNNKKIFCFPFCAVICSSWLYSSTSFLPSFSFFPYIFIKDFFTLIIVLCVYITQCHFGISTLSHPDNALEARAFLTPLHIVPEWYFLCQYTMLKVIPNKDGGFVMLLASVFCLFFLGETKKLSPLKKMMISTAENKNVSVFFAVFVCFVVIGAQFPQENFLSYGRVLIAWYFSMILGQ